MKGRRVKLWLKLLYVLFLTYSTVLIYFISLKVLLKIYYVKRPDGKLDEQKIVDTVKPLLEQGGSDPSRGCNDAIRALDPNGRIQTDAKRKFISSDAAPEEYRLAEQLKVLTGSAAQAIDYVEEEEDRGMPHAKKELNPYGDCWQSLWVKSSLLSVYY